MNLVRTCQDWGVAVETPIVGFGIYNVALLGVYLINFPWMDTSGYLRRVNVTREDQIAHGAETARKALETMGVLRARLHMADGWVGTLKRTHTYFTKLRTAWFDSAPRMMGGREREVWNDQSIATAQLHPPDAESTRVLLERVLRDMDGGDDEGEASHQLHSQANGEVTSPNVKAETAQSSTTDAHAQQEERWNAINTAAAAASALSSTTAGSHSSLPSAGPTATSQSVGAAHFRFYPHQAATGTSGSTPATPASSSYAQNQNGGFRPAMTEGSPSSKASPVAQPQTPKTAAGWSVANGTSTGASRDREGLAGTRGFASPLQRGTEAGAPAVGGGSGGFATPGQSYSALQQQQQRRASDRETRDADAWLFGLERGFGGDDVGAFVNGRAVREQARGLKGGWLGVVWGYP